MMQPCRYLRAKLTDMLRQGLGFGLQDLLASQASERLDSLTCEPASLTSWIADLPGEPASHTEEMDI